jgi:NTP pyrophosphatase (non-canonical NTP hydrolase)
MNQDKIIEHYGMASQLGIAMEECAELIQAISKMNRSAGFMPDSVKFCEAKANLEEEMADVIVCINQLQKIYDISDSRISQLANYKICRQIARMNEEKYGK